MVESKVIKRFSTGTNAEIVINAIEMTVKITYIKVLRMILDFLIATTAQARKIKPNWNRR